MTKLKSHAYRKLNSELILVIDEVTEDGKRYRDCWSSKGVASHSNKQSEETLARFVRFVNAYDDAQPTHVGRLNPTDNRGAVGFIEGVGRVFWLMIADSSTSRICKKILAKSGHAYLYCPKTYRLIDLVDIERKEEK